MSGLKCYGVGSQNPVIIYHSLVTKIYCIINSNEFAIFKAVEWLRMDSVHKPKSAVFFYFAIC